MPSRTLILMTLLASSVLMAAERKNIFPPGIKPAGPYSPGILAKDFLYVSGQGARDKDGNVPADTAGQVRQCLDNVRTIVEAAGLTMDHLAYAQFFLTSPDQVEEAEKTWKAYFPKGGPARTLLGVAKLPQETPLEINAVAVRDLSALKPVSPGGDGVPAAMLAGPRVYFSDCKGGDASTALDRMGSVLKAAGIGFPNVVFVNPYMTDKIDTETMNRAYASRFEFGNTPARATIKVAFLTHGANIQFTGVAVRDLSQRRAVRPKNMEPSPTASPCVFAGDALFCSAKSGFIPGPNRGIYASTVDTQLRQTMRNLLDGLEEAGLNLSNAVSCNVYLDDIAEFPLMNHAYAQYFSALPPTRTTVQQYKPGPRKADDKDQWPTLEQISLIAEP